MSLWLSSKEADSVFDMNRHDENSATFALGWVLAKSPTMLKALVRDLSNVASYGSGPQIKLQHYAQDSGFTDIEISSPNNFHFIIEAKRGWKLPGQVQLKKYASRFIGNNAEKLLIVSVSAASKAYAIRNQPAFVDRIRVTHRSWTDLRRMTAEALTTTRVLEEKFWLRQLQDHLKDYIIMQNTQDNRVFVVSLSPRPVNKNSNYSYIDVVEKDKRYFHPVGGTGDKHRGWPFVPPNYMGFRYRGKLQSIHHVDGYVVNVNLQSVNRKWLKTDSDHFIYRLGPPIKPHIEIRTGKIFRNKPVWCAIDTLLSGSCKTIADARDETKRRLSDNE